MKILICDLTSRFPQYTFQIYNSFKNNGYTNIYLVAGFVGENFKFLTKNSAIELFSLGRLIGSRKSNKLFSKVFKGFEFFINSIKLYNHIINSSYTTVHFQFIPLLEHFSIYEHFQLSRLKKNNIKIIYTVHNILPHNSGQKYFSKYKKLYELCDTIIVHTNSAKSELVDNFEINPDKIHIRYHGKLELMVSNSLKNEIPKYLNGLDDYLIISIFGSIQPYKNIELLIESIKLIPVDYKIKLVIAGEGHISYVKKLISLVDDDIRIILDFKFYSDDQLFNLIRRTDILVFPYKKITQSGALILGMTMSKPVIVSNLEGFKEIVTNDLNGLLFESDSIDDLTRSILKLINNPERRISLGNNAKMFTDEHFDWLKISLETYKLYN